MNKIKVAFFTNFSSDDFSVQEKIIRNLFENKWDITFHNGTYRLLNTFNKLEEYLKSSLSNSYDICFFSLKPFTISSKDKFENTINALISNKISIAFRLGTIKGIDLIYPPKMPLIDPGLLIFFPKNYKTIKRASYYPHFRSWDPQYFDLYAFIENYFTPSSYSTYDLEDKLMDKYGQTGGFTLDGFTYSPTTGIITYSDLQDNKINLVKENLVAGKGNASFISHSFLHKLYKYIKTYTRKLMKNYELVKKYDI